MSGEKPAPTAEQVAAARHWLDNDVLRVLAMGSMTAGNVRTLLAALDAAEARATAAEAAGARLLLDLGTANKRADDSEELYVQSCSSLSRERTRALTAERGLAAARAALRPFAKIEVPVGASDGTWVATTLHCGNQVTAHSVWAARAALGLGKEAPRG